LEQLFASYGTVRHAAITVDQRTGKSVDTGIVEMACDEEADTAIAALHGQLYCDRQLVVARATSRQETNAAHTSMFESMNVPDASEHGSATGPCPGGFGDRGGKGPGGALHNVPPEQTRAIRGVSEIGYPGRSPAHPK
jgi:RNA recognition motif-containing protein